MTRAIGSSVTLGAWSIGQALRECRTRVGMTVRAVAERCKATPRDVDAWEREEALPPLASFSRLFAIFPAFRGMIGEAGVRMIHAHAEDTDPTPDATETGEILRSPNSPQKTERVPHYTAKLREEMARAGLTIRGPQGLLVRSGLPFERACALLQGARPSNAEHAALVRALPRMRPHDKLRLGFLRPSVPPAEAAAADPVPPPPRAEPEAPARPAAVDPPRGAVGPDAPPLRAGEEVFLPAALSPDLPAVQDNAPSLGALGEGKSPPGTEAARKTVHDVPGGGGSSVPLTLTPRTFGEALRAAREAEGIDRKTLAELCGVVPNAVRLWELDDKNPVAENLDKLVDLLPRLRPMADKLRPKVRRMEVPRYSLGGREARAARAPAAPARPAPVALHVPAADGGDALIAFGVALGALREVLGAEGKIVAEAVLAALDAGLGAGLSPAAALAAVRKRL